MGALVDLHQKNTWQKKRQICLLGVKETGVSKERLIYTGNLTHTHTRPTHFHAS